MNLGNLSALILTIMITLPKFSVAQDCYPTNQIMITESTSQGTLFSTNSDTYPTFCTDFGTAAPAVNDAFDPVIAGTISYDNANLSTAEIENRVSRTLSVLLHPDYGVTPVPTSLSSTFFRSIQYTIWRWTDDPTNTLNSSWVANDGNTYTTATLQAWVLDGTLEPASVVWMNPVKTNIQTEVTLNLTSNADAGTDGSLAICENETLSASELFAALGGTPDVNGTWSPAPAGPGVYTFTVNSIAPCTGTSSAQVMVKGQAAPNAGISVTTNVCSNATIDETFLFTSLGGTPDYGGTWSPSINGIGTYTYTVAGVKGCGDASATVTLNEYQIETSVTMPTCINQGGRIEVTSPVSSSFVYSIDNTNFQDSPLFTNLKDGDYTITIRRNSDGCETYSKAIIINNTICAEDDTYTTDNQNQLCSNLLKNDLDGLGYTLQLKDVEGLDENGQNFSIPMTETPVEVYDVNRLLAGTLSINEKGTFCFIPNTSFAGNLALSYEAIDGQKDGASDSAIAYISVVSFSLPVELISFTASIISENVLLEWFTATEINNDYFEILRSNDGKNWTTIGKVNGNGNSTDEIDYEMLDRYPEKGINYYRLKQVDFNGDFTLTDIKEINFDSRFTSSIEVYPNPSHGQINFNIDSDIEVSTINVLDISGNYIQPLYNNNNQADISDFENGIYIIQFIDHRNSVISNKRIVKIQ